MILLIDNYDSFVFNLARYFQVLGCETEVVRHDAITLEEVSALGPEAIVISPGPKTPAEAGISVSLIRQYAEKIPIMGVCLGHQAIATAFGGSIVRAPMPVHGRAMTLTHNEQSVLFDQVPNHFLAARYHSLIVEVANLPHSLIVTCRASDGTIMAIEHESLPVYGIQFHPESVLTDCGHQILGNFLQVSGIPHQKWMNQERPQPIPIDDFFQRPIEGHVFPHG